MANARDNTGNAVCTANDNRQTSAIVSMARGDKVKQGTVAGKDSTKALATGGNKVTFASDFGLHQEQAVNLQKLLQQQQVTSCPATGISILKEAGLLDPMKFAEPCQDGPQPEPDQDKTAGIAARQAKEFLALKNKEEGESNSGFSSIIRHKLGKIKSGILNKATGEVKEKQFYAYKHLIEEFVQNPIPFV